MTLGDAVPLAVEVQQATDVVQPQAREGLAACAAVVGVDDAELRQIFDLPS